MLGLKNWKIFFKENVYPWLYYACITNKFYEESIKTIALIQVSCSLTNYHLERRLSDHKYGLETYASSYWDKT